MAILRTVKLTIMELVLCILAVNRVRYHGDRLIAGGISAAILASMKPAAAAVAPLKDRTLHLYHRQTGEFFKETYFQEVLNVADALDRVNWLMRDWRTDKTKKIDPALLRPALQRWKTARLAGKAVRDPFRLPHPGNERGAPP